MLTSFFTWLALKLSIGKTFIEWWFKYLLRDKPQSIKEEYKNGKLIKRETTYR